MEKIVVAGASLAGTRAAQTLRSRGFSGQVVLLGAESEMPYDRPPLSKQFLRGDWGRDDISLLTDDDAARLDLDVRLGCTAVGVEPSGRRLRTTSGEESYDGLVIATGARPRTMPGATEHASVHVLRTAADAAALRGLIHPNTRLGIVGGGFLGSEVASSALAAGAKVSVIEREPLPMAGALGDIVGAELASWHRSHGVDLMTSAHVTGLDAERDGRVVVRLADRPQVTFDQVLVAIGAVPNVEWLAGSGLAIDDGLLCDETHFVYEDSIVTAGDVARVVNTRGRHNRRVEHWTSAASQAEVAASNLLAGPAGATAASGLPYVWSDQFGSRIEILGSPDGGDDVEMIWASSDDRSRIYLYRTGTEPRALVGFNAMRWLVGVRRDTRKESHLTGAVVDQLTLQLRSAS